MNASKIFMIICLGFGVFSGSSTKLYSMADTVNVSEKEAPGLSELEKATYKENPWLFIQKKLIEEPNNELMSFRQLVIDALILGGTAFAANYHGYGLYKKAIKEPFNFDNYDKTMKTLLLLNTSHDHPKTTILLGLLAFIGANLFARNNAKKKALKSFITSYASTGEDSCKKYTPEKLQPLFDILANMPPEELESFCKNSGCAEALANVQKIVEEHNPTFKQDDKFNKKLKIVAAGLIALAVFKLYGRVKNISFDTLKLRSRYPMSYGSSSWLD